MLAFSVGERRGTQTYLGGRLFGLQNRRTKEDRRGTKG